MEILVATALTQGTGSGDHNYFVEGELVGFRIRATGTVAIPICLVDADADSPVRRLTERRPQPVWSGYPLPSTTKLPVFAIVVSRSPASRITCSSSVSASS